MFARGIVEDVNDPQQRFRYRVRINGLDREDTPTEALRWAEVIPPFSVSGAADIPNYEVGDRVWVGFEMGDPDFPVILGGWIAYSFGMNDVPAPQATDYTTTRKRWVRADRIGNKLVMSEVPTEQFAQLSSGAAVVQVSSLDNSVRFFALSSTVSTEAAQVSVEAQTALTHAQSVLITTDGLNALGGPLGLLQLLSNYEVALHAASADGSAGHINIGGYVPTLGGTTDGSDPRMVAQQTPEVNILGQTNNVGTGVGATQGTPPVPLNETEKTIVSGKAVTIRAQTTVNKTYPSTMVQLTLEVIGGKLVINTDQEVDITATTKVSITAPEVDVNSANINLG